ncbi:pimeloyl-ACP methyl ester carboxylesterase [Anaerobacterium chartisolvens]|uniref:Pimeloyl-ACP methyl ester carboxylesterase n=1 Tax=Anaerobacterium chartisolvens TaxID=1297424 RepID=A0A369BD14_9FIRM|nr:alpha/beta fold hydrolase [Anaerobacterium chartisolvens]RCX18347.1 pimeloyl-ACP methyl ester carboxylesterase [Anaerobacterium chartisolvens]
MIECKIKVDGFQLFMREMGQGTPTVIFESAMGGNLGSWCPVQMEVSKKARSIAYDRVGNGRSEKSPNPRNILIMARELKSMLFEARIEPPFLLVAASYGGFVSRAFASMFTDEVKGMILVDPSHEDFMLGVKNRRTEDEWQAYMSGMDMMAQRSKGCFKEEWESYFENTDCIREIKFPDNIPVIVISSSRYGYVEKNFMGLKKEDIDMKCFLHKSWSIDYPNMVQIITEKSGHDIVSEEPELVNGTILKMLESIR